MSNELIPSSEQFNALAYMAKSANASKFYQKVGGEEGLLSIMLLARELDIPPMQALSGGIWNIQGKVEMSARMMNMKIRQAGHKMKIDSDSKRCIITGTRKDTSEELTVTFSMEDATRAGLASGNVWQKYPREMLFNRCLSIIARMLFPDVIGNCYVEGEIKEVFESEQEVKQKKTENKIDVKYEPISISAVQPVIEDAKVESVADVSLQEPVTKEQLFELEDLLAGKEDRLPGMLEHFGIVDLSSMKQKDFEVAVKILKKKKA